MIYENNKNFPGAFVTNLGKETNNRQTNAAEQNKRIVKYADYISAIKKRGTSDEIMLEEYDGIRHR